MIKKLIALFSLILVILISPSAQSNSLPAFCQENFPVLERRRIDRYQTPITFTGPGGEERHCLKTHQAGLEVSVPATEILRFYSDVQKVEYRRAAQAFTRAMNEKVLRSLVKSMQPFEGLYTRQSCSDVGGNGRQKVTNRQRCERAQNITPQCRNPELNAIIQQEDQQYVENLGREVRSEIRTEMLNAGHPESALDDVTDVQIRGAENYLKSYKKQTYLQEQIKSSVLAYALIDKKKKLKEIFDREMHRNDTSLSAGSFEFGNTDEIEAHRERKRVIEQNHQRESENVQQALSRLYETNPTVLNIKHSTRYLLFSNSDYELSPFSEKLTEKFKESVPSFSVDENYNEISQFLQSDEARIAFNQIAEREVDQPNAELETLGQEQVFAELRKKREAIEMICNGEAKNLHHFQNLAHSLLEETAHSQPNNLTAQQAGYCYLAQREPPRDGSLPLGMTVVAGVAIVGGVAAQFIPVLGNALGGASIAYGIAALGGATLALDSVSRYTAAVTNDAHTQTVYQGSFAWVSAEERLRSENARRTQRNIAVAEVGLTAVDALVLARPALALFRSTIPAPPVAPATTALSVRPPNALVRSPSIPTPPTLPSAPANINLPAPAAQLRLPAPQAPALAAPAARLDAPPALVNPALPPPPPVNRVSAAQREALEQFQRLTPSERAQRIGLIRSRLQAGQVEETEFLTMIMHTGNYTADVFTPGPQEMALNLMNALGDREAALRVVREFYQGKNSARSQGRLRELETLINDIHPSSAPTGTALVAAAPRSTEIVTAAPTPPVPAVLSDSPNIIVPIVDDVVPRSAPPQLPNDDFIEGTFRVIDDVPAIEAPPAIRLTASDGGGEAVSAIRPVGGATILGTTAARGAIALSEGVATPAPAPEREREREREPSPVPAVPLEIIVTIEKKEQTYDSDFGFRQILRATAVVRTGEPLPSDFQFTWRSDSLDGDDTVPPRIDVWTVAEIEVPAMVTAYSVIASGTSSLATVIDSPAVVVKQDDIPVSLSIVKVVNDTSVDLVVNATLSPDMPVPVFEYIWEATGPHELSGERITFSRREQEYSVFVNARAISGYRITSATDTIPALVASEPVPSPTVIPPEVDDSTAVWTVYIESAQVIPETAKMKIKLKAVPEGGSTLPSNLSLSLETFKINDKEPPTMPAAITGSEAEFEISLIEHPYGITARSVSGERVIKGDDRRIDACLEVATAVCTTEEGEELDAELPLPPGQPPQRFSPLQVPTPQMFVIPGFF